MNFYVPVKVVTGKGCVCQSADSLKKLGKRCLIATGKNAAKRSGALDDVICALDSRSIGYTVFDGIEQNPSYASCLAAAMMAKADGADFIIGIGGGSPLDAAKAIAVLAACTDTSEEAFYAMRWDGAPLPVVAIGTTAGTGSEVTPVAVITTTGGLKKSVRSDAIYPRMALGDASYMTSLSPEFTRSTALDALSHCLESYFNRTANEMSRAMAARGISILAGMLEKTVHADTAPLTLEDREELYAASLYGGYAISVTGTAFPHAMGYFLSEQYGIPHGNACAIYLEEFISHNAAVAPKEAEALFLATGTDQAMLTDLIRRNLPDISITLTAEEVARLSPRFESNKSLMKSYGTVDRDFATRLLTKLLVK